MELIKQLYKLLDDKQAEAIKVYDFKNNSPFLDYFVIVTARNERLGLALIREVEDFANKNNLSIISKDTNKESKWLLIDIGSIVVHIFVNEERVKYNLDGLWKDLEIEL